MKELLKGAPKVYWAVAGGVVLLLVVLFSCTGAASGGAKLPDEGVQIVYDLYQNQAEIAYLDSVIASAEDAWNNGGQTSEEAVFHNQSDKEWNCSFLKENGYEQYSGLVLDKVFYGGLPLDQEITAYVHLLLTRDYC